MSVLHVLLALSLAAPAQPDASPPATADVPAPEPAALSLAGARCQGIARYLNVGSANAAQLSPDGRQLLFLTSTSGLPQLWVAPVDGDGPGLPQQLTFGANRVEFARWSPDGRWIAYGTDRGGNERTQFFLVSPDGTREVQLTPADEHYRLFNSWSPDGRRIAYVSTERNGRDFDLYLMEIDDAGRVARSRRVLEGSGNLALEAWRPDGGALVLSQGRGEADNDLFLYDLRTGKRTPLFQPARASRYRSVQWTPDGRGFYLATNHERDFAGLAYYSVADGALRWLQEPAHDVEAVALSHDGSRLAYVVNEGGFSRFVVRDLSTGNEHAVPGLPRGALRSIEWARHAPSLAIGLSAPGVPGDVWVYDASTSRVSRATRSTLAGLDPAGFIAPEPVRFRSEDDETIHALFYRPTASDPASRPPVVMMLHGGPTSQARPSFDAVKQYLLARGYAVLDLNFRGSLGYGQRYTQLDNQRLRPNTLRDLRAAVEWLRGRRDVDGHRVAAMGPSYGGYLTLAAVAQLPEHFQAGVDIVGVANWITGLEDASPSLKNSDRIEYGDIENPDDREFFRRISPLSYAHEIRSPLMVVHGANDPRVPIGEADQIVRAVRDRGGDVEYLRFPDEGHGIAKLANRVTAYQRIARFLDRALRHEAAGCDR